MRFFFIYLNEVKKMFALKYELFIESCNGQETINVI